MVYSTVLFIILYLYFLPMFLYTKRSRKIVRYLWIIFAILIIISMVVAYSGFTLIAPQQNVSHQTEPIENIRIEDEDISSEEEFSEDTSLEENEVMPLSE
jgi:glucan phosphoethanolaminetransferase (alkaline phosphatase superfamily)